ncbi:hypothetical protein IAE35_05630 [Pseudomonas sp. S75]|uniref:hypothetical protein n=1 Tax=unclassified Pseudomonas TaxID=196821 RepID=UPI0019041235|nr:MULTISPECIES: hypothetical protein [unclassified Pseudomonas]MBJ9975213.1 hypothetical protein [Pseudomonas sp. S30]MBK0152813.1 hypothetical protein [Pseudomonas sp. S75]
MTAFRRFALMMCIVLSGWTGTVVQAAQAQAATETAQPQGAQPPAKSASTSAAKKPTKAVSKVAKKPASKAKRKTTGRKSASKPTAQAAPNAKLDLSLPTDMVKNLKPSVNAAPTARKPLLPAMFPDKPVDDSPFQLNGRLISNEMQLQLRNDSRRDVEGAALDFEFRN